MAFLLFCFRSCGTMLAMFLYAVTCSGQSNFSYLAPRKETWLPHQAIRALYQDKAGNIWVGTNAGLFKYNLYDVVNFNLTKRANNRLLNNTIHAISEDSRGNILVGTESGLGQLTPSTGDLKVLTREDETISQIVSGRQGFSYFMTANGRVFRLHSSADANTSPLSELIYKSDPGAGKPQVRLLLELPDGNLLLGGQSGLYILNPFSKQLSPTGFYNNVSSLSLSARGRIWVGTVSSGLFELEITGKSRAVLSIKNNFRPGNAAVENYITAIKTLSANTTVVTTPTRIFLVKNSDNKLTIESAGEGSLFAESAITDVLTDKTANIWIGSKIGLYKISSQIIDVSYTAAQENEYRLDNNLTDIHFLSSSTMLMAKAAGGIYAVSLKSGADLKLALPLSSARLIRSTRQGDLLIVGESKVLLVSQASLYKANPEYTVLAQGEKWSQVNDIEEVSDGEWWASSWRHGLLRVSVNGDTNAPAAYLPLKNHFTSTSHLYSIHKDRQQNIWIGTRGEGLVKYNLNTRQLNRYGKTQHLSDRIICIAEDAEGKIWVGSRGDGLQAYNPDTNTFTVYEEKDGLPSNTICAIAQNAKGELWVSTLNGVAAYSKSGLVPFQSYGQEDGISNAEFSFHVAAADDDGNVYFGTATGMYRFYKKLPAANGILPIVWTRIELLNTAKEKPKRDPFEPGATQLLHEVEQGGSLSLRHHQNSLVIGFASLNFTSPEKNRYAYRLLGKDEQWKLLQGARQEVQYLDLAPGNYSFEVRASGLDGSWSQQSQTFSFSIAPSFWNTRYAYMLYALLAVVMGLGIVLMRRRWYKLNRQLSEERESSRLHSWQMVHYADLSHEIKNRLSLLLGPLEQALHGKKVNPQILNNLYEQGLRLKKLTDQIMDIRKSESGGFMLTVAEEDLLLLVKTIVKEAAPLAVVKNITVKFNSKKETIKGWCDEELAEIAVMNLVGNAIKYCKTDGRVEVNIDTQFLGENDLPEGLTREGNYFCCEVTDTGVGIATTEIDKILEPFYRAGNVRHNKKETPGSGVGLNLVARLVSKHHGSLHIRSEENEFTTVTVYLPIDRAAYNISELKPDIVHTPIIMSAARPEHRNDAALILPAASAPAPAAAAVKNYCILAADDNDEVLKLLHESLADEFSVITAGNGEEAFTILEQQEVHLIISDLDMPVMDGLTLCRMVRSQQKMRSIPFLLLTGRNSEEQKRVAFQNQVDDFIEKPFSPELLKWRVKSFLRSSAAQVKLKTVMVVEPKAAIVQSEEDEFIQSIVSLIEQHLDKDYLGVDFLAENLYSSRATFYRKMEQMVGESPSLFIRKYRLKKAALLLQKSNLPVATVAQKTGFSSAKYFVRCFQKEFGVHPAEFVATNSTA